MLQIVSKIQLQCKTKQIPSPEPRGSTRVFLWLVKPNATVSASFLCGELAAATVGYPAFLL